MRLVSNVRLLAAVTLAMASMPEGEADLRAAPTTSYDFVPAEMLSHLTDSTQAFCQWHSQSDSKSEQVDADDLEQAIENSAAWIRAVLREGYTPDDLEQRIVGCVDEIEGYDVTRAAFEEGGIEFLISQHSYRIVVVARPACDQESMQGQRGRHAVSYLSDILRQLFRHARAIEFLRSKESTSFGAQLTPDNNLYNERGVALSATERKRISELPPTERSEERRRLKRLHEGRLREIDPTIPERSIGGSFHFWWGQVYAWTDGYVIVFSAGKGYGGKMAQIEMPDWFRKEKLSAIRLKSYGLPMPPKDAPAKGDD